MGFGSYTLLQPNHPIMMQAGGSPKLYDCPDCVELTRYCFTIDLHIICLSRVLQTFITKPIVSQLFPTKPCFTAVSNQMPFCFLSADNSIQIFHSSHHITFFFTATAQPNTPLLAKELSTTWLLVVLTRPVFFIRDI